MVGRDVLKVLSQTARPVDGCTNCPLLLSNAEENLLGVLRQEA